ncbi:hypothetical protein DL96DRAFT_1448920, partial [Flagelloscypha sp. PMI_526]
GSCGALRKMESLQRSATLAILGCYRTTPTDLLDAHANLWPMELYLDRLCHRATTRVCSLPITNPVAKIAKGITRRVKKQPSPLHVLMDRYSASWERTETITPAIRRPTKSNKFKIIIPTSRKESKELEEKDDADIKIASDGSGYEGGIGAAAVLWRRDRE